MKKCSRCGIEKPKKQFSSNKSKPDGLQYACKECQRESSKKHYQNNKKQYLDRKRKYRNDAKNFIDDLKSKSKCKECGFDDPRALQFHHVDPKEKSFCIASALNVGVSIKNLKIEIEKCDVLCANCHSIHHHLSRQSI